MSVTTWWSDCYEKHDSYYLAMSCFLGKVAGAVVDEVGEAYDSIAEDIFGGFDKYIEGILSSINRFVTTKIGAVIDNVEDILDEIENYATSLYNEAATLVGGLVDDIDRFIERQIDDATEYVTDLLIGVSNFIDSSIDNIDNLTDFVASQIESGIQTVESFVNRIYEDATGYVTFLVDEGIAKSEALYNEAVSGFTDLVNSGIENVSSLVESVELAFNGIYDSLVEDLDRQMDLLGGVGEDFATSAAGLIGSINQEISPALKSIRESVGSPFNAVEGENNKRRTQSVIDGFADLFHSIDRGFRTHRLEIQDLDNTSLAQTVLGGTLNSIMMALSTALHYVQVLSINNTVKNYQFLASLWSDNPVMDYSPAEAASLAARRFITENEAFIAMRKGGLNEEKSRRLVEASANVPDIERAKEAFNRGIISESDYEDIADRQAIKEADRILYRGLRSPLPPVQDIISMAVRDAFSDDAVGRFELHSDLPSEFVRYAGQHGYSKEWAEHYWAAHWRLPSANQGFEMYHRGVIDQDTLRLLLRALDVSPFWRDKLEAIAYQPITRVDVRRMYALGVLDEVDVERRYLDLGYSPRDAEFMTMFTKAYAGEDDPDDDVNIMDLSRAQIERLWGIGTIDDVEAVSRMIDLGYSPEIADLLVKSWSDEEAAREREDMIKRLIRHAIKHDLKGQALDELFNDVGLTNTEQRKIYNIIEVEQGYYDSIPSKTELVKMVKSGAITRSEYRQSMHAHGYSSKWIDKYEIINKI